MVREKLSQYSALTTETEPFLTRCGIFFYFIIGNWAWVTNSASGINKERRPVRMRYYLNQTHTQLAESAKPLLVRRHACRFPFIVILLGLPSVMPGADVHHHVSAAGLKRLILTTSESWHALSPVLTPTTVAPHRPEYHLHLDNEKYIRRSRQNNLFCWVGHSGPEPLN